MHPAKPDQVYDLTVLGDLHGCYSCLKGALLQADFFAKLEAWKLDKTKPEPKLILLGDYIDRGRFSYNGVLRAVMQLYLAAPDHVFPLRGNHEYYIEYRGRIYGGVKPAEAINTLIGHMPGEVFAEYMKMFEELPNMLFFDDLMFVHAGIPRDVDIKAQAPRHVGAQRSGHPVPDDVERSVDGGLHPRRSAGAERAVPVRQAAVRGVHAEARLLDARARPREGRFGVPADVQRTRRR